MTAFADAHSDARFGAVLGHGRGGPAQRRVVFDPDPHADNPTARATRATVIHAFETGRRIAFVDRDTRRVTFSGVSVSGFGSGGFSYLFDDGRQGTAGYQAFDVEECR